MALDSSLGQGRNWKSLPKESCPHEWAGWEPRHRAGGRAHAGPSA